MTTVNPVEIEHIFRVYYEDHYLEIGDWPDGTDHLELRTHSHSKDYFGPINLAMTPAHALALGKALVAAAEEKGACPFQ